MTALAHASAAVIRALAGSGHSFVHQLQGQEHAARTPTSNRGQGGAGPCLWRHCVVLQHINADQRGNRLHHGAARGEGSSKDCAIAGLGNWGRRLPEPARCMPHHRQALASAAMRLEFRSPPAGQGLFQKHRHGEVHQVRPQYVTPAYPVSATSA